MLLYSIGGTQSAVGQRQALLRLVLDQVEADAHFEAATLNRSGRRPRGAQALLLRMDLGLVDQRAERRDQRILPVDAVLGR